MNISEIFNKKHALRSRLYFAIQALALIIGFTPLIADAADDGHNAVLKGLTCNLPAMDRIEIESVHVNFETIDKVLATKVLTGNGIQQFENIWKSQNYTYDISVNCHAPAYRIRFYKNEALLTEATVCFHCHNIYFYKYPGAKYPDAPWEAVFGNIESKDADQAYGKLRTYLSDLFPGHDPNPTSSE